VKFGSAAHGAAVILEPIAVDWTWLDALVGPVDADCQRSIDEQPTAEVRDGLHRLFD
jgi:antitoxin VapB